MGRAFKVVVWIGLLFWVSSSVLLFSEQFESVYDNGITFSYIVSLGSVIIWTTMVLLLLLVVKKKMKEIEAREEDWKLFKQKLEFYESTGDIFLKRGR
jgi:hypothetical protein